MGLLMVILVLGVVVGGRCEGRAVDGRKGDSRAELVREKNPRHAELLLEKIKNLRNIIVNKEFTTEAGGMCFKNATPKITEQQERELHDRQQLERAHQIVKKMAACRDFQAQK